VELAQAVTPPPAEAPVVAQAAPATLPATGSSLPLVALFGLLALGGAWTAKLAKKRVL
jgi:LPXTG-motif cell wall-anchored protein